MQNVIVHFGLIYFFLYLTHALNWILSIWHIFFFLSFEYCNLCTFKNALITFIWVIFDMCIRNSYVPFIYNILNTWTLDSGKLILSATSSRIKMSGYLVLPNSDSSTSNWARVNVVRSRRCFRELPVTNKIKYFRWISYYLNWVTNN